MLIKIDNCLQNLEKNTFREVYHIWYLWPVNGVQSDGAGLIAVLLEARALQRGGPGPIVVHCSPGTGRTGTLIALDLGIRQYEITRTVDVPRVVYTIRRDRAGAVKTKEQYAFIYKVIYFLTWPCLFPFESFISFIRLFRLALCIVHWFRVNRAARARHSARFTERANERIFPYLFIINHKIYLYLCFFFLIMLQEKCEISFIKILNENFLFFFLLFLFQALNLYATKLAGGVLEST